MFQVLNWRVIAAFLIFTVILEVVSVKPPLPVVKKVSGDQEWRLPVLVDKGTVSSLAESASSSLVWGLESAAVESAPKATWQLKGIVKSGSALSALVASNGKIQRVSVGESLGDGRVQAIKETGIVLFVQGKDGSQEEQFVKVHQ